MFETSSIPLDGKFEEGLRKMFDYGMRTPPHCRDREDTGVIRPGARVRLVGLSARGDLNGEHAEVKNSYDVAKGRWAVRLASGECVRVKPSNIRVDAEQPACVPSAAQWLLENTPPGREYRPPKPPIVDLLGRDALTHLGGTSAALAAEYGSAADEERKASQWAAEFETYRKAKGV
jgi:hypothetical protein